MRKLLLLFVIVFMAMTTLGFSQSLMDYVQEVRGDTLVIKDYWDMDDSNNSLYFALLADTVDVPEGRVYMLKPGGYYPLMNDPTTLRRTVIVGDFHEAIVQADGGVFMPLICGAVDGDNVNNGSFNANHDIVFKNVNITPSHPNLGFGWSLINTGGDGVGIWLDNCLFERTRWVFLVGNNIGNKIYIKNSYFVNMVGQPCRRNGGVYDGWNWENDMWIENNTHIHAQGSIYKLRANIFNKVVFNHNTFVNCAGYTILDLGYQTEMSVTNNIFVNSNVQPYSGLTYDTGECDDEQLPIGIINMIPMPDSIADLTRRYYFNKNVTYWDDSIVGDEIIATLNENNVNNSSEWVSQTILMNDRSKGMFDDDETYPYLVEGTTYTQLPTFTDPQDLLTTQLQAVKTFSIATSDTASPAIMTDWRLTSPAATAFLFCDWPIPVDLSYDDAELVTGGLGGFPVGDLNWFPTEKAAWEAQRDQEYANIQSTLETGIIHDVAVEDDNRVPVEFTLAQNYPNPFNPTTSIQYSLTQSGNVTLKVYDAIGREVATLVNGFKNANQTYNVDFDATNLSSGVYFYTIKAGNQTETRKMMLLK